MRTNPSAPHPVLQAATPSTRTVLGHGSHVSRLAVSLMLAFPGISYAGGAPGGNGFLAPAGTSGGAGAGYSVSNGITSVGASAIVATGTASAGGSGGGGAGTAGTATSGGGGGGAGSAQHSPSGLTSAVTGGAGGGGAATGMGSIGNGGGGDGAVLTSGGTVNVAVTGGAGGTTTLGGGGGGGGAGIVYTPADASLTIGSAVTGGSGGKAAQGGGGGGSGVWVTSSGAVNVTTTGIVAGGSGGAVVLATAAPGAGGAGIVFGSTGGQLQVDGQVLGGTTSGSGAGGAGVNIMAGGVAVTVDNGAVIAGGAGGTAISTPGTGITGSGGAGSGGAAGGNLKVVNTGTGGIGIVAAGGGNTIVTSGAINGATGLAGQANAITFSGNNNTLELHAGYSFTGNVVDGSSISHFLNPSTGDTLVLGGATNASFNASSLVATASASSPTTQYAGFNTLNKTGTSTWTLTGVNLFLGATNVAQGTLQAGNAAAFSLVSAVSVAGNATLDLNNFNQSIASLTGAGNVTLGTATLKTGNGSNTTFDGVISGTGGGLTKQGTGTFILTGANTYSGNTTISAGVLQVGAGGASGSLGTGAVIDNAALVFNRSDALTVANAISGSGSVTQSGGGNLILTGTNLYTGSTLINSGTLSVNGSIVSDTTINNGGTLGGNGTVGNVTVAGGGVLAPGNSIGTLHVNGDLTFNTDAIYQVQVDVVGNADRTDVTGNVALAGAVDVQAGTGNYAANTSYTILTNTAARSGAFNGVTTNLAFLTPTLSYDPTHVYLNLARNNISFGDVAATKNQRATSGALENAATGASGDMNTVLTAVTGLSAAQARASFEAISGAGLIALRRVGPVFADNFGSQLRARLNAVSASPTSASATFNGIQLAANDQVDDLMPALAQAPQQKFSLSGGIPQASTDTRGFWLRGYGSDHHTDGDDNAASYHTNDAGMSVGFDTKVSNNLVIGAALTHGSSDIDTDNNENGHSRGNAAAVYTNYVSGPWSFNGSATLARNDNSMQRRISFGGIDRTARSDFDSDTAALYGDVTYDLPMAGWTLQPLAGLALSRNKSDGFTETGADTLNLQVDSQIVNSAKTLFGAKAIFDFEKVQLQPRVIWAHEFGNANRTMTAQFQGAPTPAPFAISGVDLPRDSLIAGMTIAGRTNEKLSLFADVQGEFNSQQTNLGLLVGLRASW